MTLNDFLEEYSGCKFRDGSLWYGDSIRLTPTSNSTSAASTTSVPNGTYYTNSTTHIYEANTLPTVCNINTPSKENEPMKKNAPVDPFAIERIHFNGPATVIIWKDGTKSVVKAMSDTKANPYHGFCAAVAQKVFGSNCSIKRIIKQYGGVDVNRDVEPIKPTAESAKSEEHIESNQLTDEDIEAAVKEILRWTMND